MKRDYPVVDVLRTGQNIKNIMKARGLSVRDIQSFLQLGTPQGIYHWFDGRSMPTLDNIYALSELFCVPVDVILKGNRKYVYVPWEKTLRDRMGAYYEMMLQMRRTA